MPRGIAGSGRSSATKKKRTTTRAAASKTLRKTSARTTGRAKTKRK